MCVKRSLTLNALMTAMAEEQTFTPIAEIEFMVSI